VIEIKQKTMTEKDLRHAYFLLNGFVENLDKEEIDRNYLLELQQWFLEQFKEMEEANVFTVKPCHSAEFKGIECLEMEDKYGFFKSDADVRPGHAIWIKKEEAERLYNLFIEYGGDDS